MVVGARMALVPAAGSGGVEGGESGKVGSPGCVVSGAGG